MLVIILMNMTPKFLALISFVVYGSGIFDPTEIPTQDSGVRPVMLGFDVVEYFSLDASAEGVKGSSQYSSILHTDVSYKEAKEPINASYTFYFKNAANKALFDDNPWKYAPRWGGFCAWGIAKETEDQGWPWEKDHVGPPGGPQYAWKVYKDQLYTAFFSKPLENFFEDAESNIKLADARWESWWGALPAGPFNTDCLALGKTPQDGQLKSCKTNPQKVPPETFEP